jgi:hypothetical protein
MVSSSEVPPGPLQETEGLVNIEITWKEFISEFYMIKKAGRLIFYSLSLSRSLGCATPQGTAARAPIEESRAQIFPYLRYLTIFVYHSIREVTT